MDSIWLSSAAACAPRLAHLRCSASSLLVERAASRGELLALTHQVLGACGSLASCGSKLNSFASVVSALTRAWRTRSATELVFEQAELGIAAYVVDHHEHVAGAHLLPVAHADFAHDAAFAVLHGLALELHLDARGGDHRARDRRERRPADHQRDCDHGQRNQHDAAIRASVRRWRFRGGASSSDARLDETGVLMPAPAGFGRGKWQHLRAFAQSREDDGRRGRMDSNTPLLSTASLSSCFMMLCR